MPIGFADHIAAAPAIHYFMPLARAVSNDLILSPWNIGTPSHFENMHISANMFGKILYKWDWIELHKGISVETL